MQGKARRVKELAIQQFASAPIDRIAQDGETPMGEMHADLVGAPGFQRQGQQGVTRRRCLRLIVRAGSAAILNDGHALAMVRMASDWGVDGVGFRRNDANCHRLVLF